MLPGIIHQFRGKGGGQLRAVRLHKIIQTVTDTDALHLLMRANITSGSLIYFTLFHVDNLAQRLQAPAAMPAAGKLFAVCLFGLVSSSRRCSQVDLFA
jgi:hypothetical protein